MATLTPTELAAIRKKLAKDTTVTWLKADIDAASQAAENRLQGGIAALNADIEIAAPGVFDVAQKKSISANAALRFARSEGAT